MKKIVLLLLTVIFAIAIFAQSNSRVGGNCDGCDAIYDSPIPPEKLNWIDTLPDFNEPGPKLMVRGKIYKSDKKTPAPGVILYIYHTDQTGHYKSKPYQKGSSIRHGYIQGWMRTNEKGEYKFFTLKPAHYPGNKAPAHIHCIVKEPGKNEYYIDEYLFDDDPVITPTDRQKQEKRGGSGIIILEKKNGMLASERDIYLGMNIPNYGG